MFNPAKRQKIHSRIWILIVCKNFGNKFDKKLMDTATKTGIDAAKTGSKRAEQKLQRLLVV